MYLDWFLWGFKFWMLFDVLTRRRGPIVWIALVLLIPALRIGGVIYFFLAKAIDWGYLRGLDHNQAEPSRRGTRAAPTPITAGQTLTRRLDAADQLEKNNSHVEATALYQSVLESAPDNLRAMHGLARCQLGMGHPEQAAETLEKVLEKNREFAGFSAALDYAEALSLCKRVPEAIELMQGLVQHTGRINHRLGLAHYLTLAGRTAEAIKVLEQAHESYMASDVTTQAEQRRWFDKVAALRRNLAN